MKPLGHSEARNRRPSYSASSILNQGSTLDTKLLTESLLLILGFHTQRYDLNW